MYFEDNVSLSTDTYSDEEDYSQTTYGLHNCSDIYYLVVDEWPPCSWLELEAEVLSDPCAFDEFTCNETYAGRGVISSTAVYPYATWQSSLFRKWQIALIGVFAGCVSLVTILGNLIVLLSFILHRNIRQTSNYFIASLAVSDLLIGTISMPLYTVYFLSGKNWPLGETPCDLWLALDYTVCLCSIYTVFCITVDRFCSVTLPARYQMWRTERKVVWVLCLVWFVPALVFFTSVIGWQYIVRRRTVPSGKCYVQYMENALFNCLLQVGYFWVTLVAMCVLYGGIYRVALRLNHRARTRRKRMVSLVSIAGETITKIGISVSRSPTKGKYHEGLESDERAVEWCEGEVGNCPGKERGEEDGLYDEGDRESRHGGNGKEPFATKKSQELPEDDNRNAESCPSPVIRDEFWEESEVKVSGLKRKCSRRCNPTKRGRNQEVQDDNRVRVKDSSSRCHLRKAFDNITRAGSSTQVANIPLVYYETTGHTSSSDEEGSSKNCGGQYHHCRRELYDEPAKVQTEVERFVAPGCKSTRTCDERDQGPRNNSSICLFKVDSESSTSRIVRGKARLKTHENDPDGSRRGFSSRTFSDRILMRGGSSVVGQKRRTIRMRTKRANCIAKKSLRTITLILGAFVLCWTPWHVLSLIMGFCPGHVSACVPSGLYDVSYWLCYLNSCINPFCYAFANQHFKKAFLHILQLDWRRT